MSRALLDSSLDVTFFVPCYNEAKNIQSVLNKLVGVSRTLELSYEILVFDDASTDGTADIVRQYQSESPGVSLRLFVLPENRGVARNFVEGAFEGHGRYYRLICGDDVEPVETHLEILRWRGKADIIVPYFTTIHGRTRSRAVLSRLYTRVVNLIAGRALRYYNGCPLYQRFDVLRFHVEATGFGYQAEFLTRLLQEGRSYVEVPLTASDRPGSGSLSARNFLSVSHSLLKIGLRRMRVYLIK
jgi:glycosyltransferase involved in cell wall biosynthesis